MQISETRNILNVQKQGLWDGNWMQLF